MRQNQENLDWEKLADMPTAEYNRARKAILKSKEELTLQELNSARRLTTQENKLVNPKVRRDDITEMAESMLKNVQNYSGHSLPNISKFNSSFFKSDKQDYQFGVIARPAQHLK